MSTVAAFFVFVLIMLALATLAIILDWMGKPIRRSFRPRTTGTPAWLITEAYVSPEVPVVGPAPDFTAAPETWAEPIPPTELPSDQPPANQPPAEQAPADQASASQPPALNPAPPPAETAPPGPWQAGDSIFKLTPKGTPPSITAIRRRYWKNLSEHRASAVFGEANRTLMAIGQAPQRFNPRTSAIEDLELPEPMLRRCWTSGRKPSPSWGDQGLDPYAEP